MSNDSEKVNDISSVGALLPVPAKPDKVPIDQQAKNLIVSGAKCVPGAGNILGEVASQVLKVGEYSPEQRLRNLQFDWLVEVLPPILTRIERLIDEGVHVESPDIGAIFEAALDASRKTTGKKRNYLKKALENAFSLKMYEEGQVLRFFRILRELEYGDILLLEYVVSVCEDPLVEVAAEPNIEKNIGGPIPVVDRELPVSLGNNLDFHMRQLVAVNLAFPRNIDQIYKVNRNSAAEFIWFVTADDEDLENDDE